MANLSRKSWADVVKSKEEFSQVSKVKLSHIPDDIIRSILSKLPRKYLFRFKCVSKHWKSIISDPKFITPLLNLKSAAVFMSYNESHYTSLFLDSYGFIQKVPWKESKGFKSFIIGSCNGLLLVTIKNSLFLWNPLVRYFRKVQELNLLSNMRISISGICYNSLIGDYKVVMGLKYRCDHLTPGFCNCPRGFVLVSGLKDKRWKEIDGFSNYSVYGKRIGVLFNGFLHWTVVDAEMAHEFWPPNKIIGFDPKTDEVNEIPLPISKNKEEICILGLGVLEGSLCMTCWDPEFCCKGNIEVFVMKEYGIQESWIPLFDIWGLDINPHSTPLIPLFLTKNGVVVLVMGDWKTSVFWYNPQSKKYKYLEDKVAAKYCRWCDCDVVVESFEWPKGYGWNKKQHNRLSNKNIIWPRPQEHSAYEQSEEDLMDFDTMYYNFGHSLFYI